MAANPHLDARVGVVIATRDRASMLHESLARLLALPEVPPVVVVDNGSDDMTVEAARRFDPSIEVISLGKNLGAAARNHGVRHLSCPYVAFADDDSWYEPGSLQRAADLFDAHSNLGLIAARVLVGEEQALDPTCLAMERSRLPCSPGLPGPAVLGFLACGSVVRRTAFLAAGGFHERFGIGGEESLLAIDMATLGWDRAYVESIVAYHHPPPRPDTGARRRVLVRNALWTAWLRRRLPGVLWHSMAIAGRNLADRTGRAGILDALRSLPSVLSERQPVSPALDRLLQHID